MFTGFLKKFTRAAQPSAPPRTALMIAADKGDDTAITSLLAAGANPLEKDATGKTALDILRQSAQFLRDNFAALDDLVAGEPEIMLARYKQAEKILAAATQGAATEHAVGHCVNGTEADITIRQPLRLKPALLKPSRPKQASVKQDRR